VQDSPGPVAVPAVEQRGCELPRSFRLDPWSWKTPWVSMTVKPLGDMRRRSTPVRFLFPAALLLGAYAPDLGAAQGASPEVHPDTLRVDTIPIVRLQGIQGLGGRAGATPGGSSLIRTRFDSLAVSPAPSLETVLRAMPLMQIRTNSRGEAQPSLRGGKDRQVAVIYDGIVLTLGWDHRTDLSLIPMSAAHTITVSRGLPSVLLGPNVTSGVIEVSLARGEDRLTDVDPLRVGFEAEATGGYSLSATGETLLERAGGQWVFRLGTGFRDRPGFAAAPEDPGSLLDRQKRELRANSDFRQVNGYVQGRYRADGGEWFSVAASGFDLERGVPPETHITNPRLWRYPMQRNLLTAITGGTGSQRTPWGEGDLEFAVGVHLGRYRIDSYESNRFDNVTGYESGDGRTLTNRLLWEHTLGRRGDLRGTATWADITHNEDVSGETGLFRQRLWSLAGETEWRLAWGHITTVSIGGSLDGADTPESAGRPPLDRFDGWGGRMGVTTATPSGMTRFHAAGSRRMRFPALRELYSGALGRFHPNPELRPEEQRALEAGVTFTLPRGQLQMVAFHDHRSDGIVRSTIQTPEGSRFFRVNRDEVRGTGLEVLSSVGVGSLTLGGDLTLQRVRSFVGKGRPLELEYEPGIAGRAFVSAFLPAGFQGSANMIFRGGQKCVDPAGSGLLPLRSGRVSDIGVERTLFFRRDTRSAGLPSRIAVRAGLDNVTDALVLDQCGLPQPGRTLRIQFRAF